MLSSWRKSLKHFLAPPFIEEAIYKLFPTNGCTN
jgi:hypothetical protein